MRLLALILIGWFALDALFVGGLIAIAKVAARRYWRAQQRAESDLLADLLERTVRAK